MLAEKRAIGYVHEQTEQKRRCESDAPRLPDAPVKHDERDQIRSHPHGPTGPRHHIEQRRQYERQRYESGPDRKQNFVGAEGLHHAPRLAFLAGALTGFSSSTGRSGADCWAWTTSTCVWWFTPASGLQIMRANRNAALRSTLETSATGSPGG